MGSKDARSVGSAVRAGALLPGSRERQAVSGDALEDLSDLFFRSLKISGLADFDIFLHWTMWLLPIFVLGRGLVFYPQDETALQVALVFGVYACVILHELAHVQVARWLKLGMR